MENSKKYLLSVEVYKYPYCGKLDETEDYLSDKVCRCTIKIRKKIVLKTKRVFIYAQLIFSLGNGLAPTQAIGLPFLPTGPSIMGSIHSNVGLSKKQVIVAQVTQDMSVGIVFTKVEMDELYEFSLAYKNNCLSKEDLISKIINLRGGSFEDVISILTVISHSSSGFQPNPHPYIPARLQWL